MDNTDDTYWSISFFSTDTDNFYVKNDRQLKSNPARFFLVNKNKPVTPPKGVEVIKAVTDKGIILFRSLIKNEAHFKDLDRARRRITVKIVD
ncbi:MAG: DUF1254 domain-containing protein [Deltaproteobacteria bacterium]|nr:DUF1254 domain-containing protein [Deltaproteobacteria bacterium]